MEPPKNAKVYDWEASTFWFDEYGILCSVSKRSLSPRSLETAKGMVEELKKIIGDKKKCMLFDVTQSSESTKEVRNYAAAEFPKFIKALALISGSALGKMVANLFFTLKTPPYPTRMFTSEREAKEWLKQYL